MICVDPDGGYYVTSYGHRSLTVRTWAEAEAILILVNTYGWSAYNK